MTDPLPPTDVPPQAPRTQVPVSPTTTAEQDRHTRIARYENLVQEFTQSSIAMMVTIVCLYVLASLALGAAGIPSMTALNALNLTFGLIIGFYFGRTNHARTGGVVENKDTK